MSGEQIEKGTNGRLMGTHVYGVSIDRSKEPESAKTMKGITEFSDFEYFYDENKNLQYIIARNPNYTRAVKQPASIIEIM